MSSPPPPVPRRPSLKILKKLKTVINNGSEKKTANNKNIETTGETSILPKKNTNETIESDKTSGDGILCSLPTEKKCNNNGVILSSKREIYYGNRALLFATTETGGFFLGSDSDGYAVLSDIPTPVCFTNARNPFLRYGDVVRVMAHNCNLIGHTSNSWMSWSKDVVSTAGLYRITPPEGIDKITRTFRYGAPVEYGMPFLLYSDNWKTNIIGMVNKNTTKRLALNSTTKSWLEPLTFMCQIYRSEEPKKITEAKLVTKSRASSEPYISNSGASKTRMLSTSLSPTQNIDSINSSDENVDDVALGKINSTTAKKSPSKKNRVSIIENMKNTFTKAAKKDSSREELKIKIDNIKAMHSQLNKRGKTKQNEWKKEIKKVVEMQLKAAEEAKRLLEEDLKKLSSNKETVNNNINDNVDTATPATDTKNFDSKIDRSEFLDIENLIKATTNEIIKLKLQLYCPKVLRFNHSFHFNGYFCGMEDYAIQQVALSFHFSFTSATNQNPHPQVKIQLKPFTIILKAFGLKLVTESNEGVKQSTRSFKELTINTGIVLDTTLKFCSEEDDKKDRTKEEMQKKIPTVTASNVNIVKDSTSNNQNKESVERGHGASIDKGHPPAKESENNNNDDDDKACSWVPVSYRCEVIKAMDDEGKEGGFIPGVVKKLANYYLPSFVKEYILWYLTNDFGIYLRKFKNQSFTFKGEFTLNGTKLSVLKSNITKNSVNSKEALQLLGNLTFSQAKLLMKLREVIGKSFGSLWQTKWDCVHALKTYVQHMHGHMETKEEWVLFKEAWQNLVDHVYSPPGQAHDRIVSTQQNANTNTLLSKTDEQFNTSVLNIGEIFENILALLRKPVYATLSLNSISAKLNLNKFSKMQYDVGLFAIHRSLELEKNAAENTPKVKEKKARNDGESNGASSTTSLRAQRHQIALNLLEEWYDNRLDTLDFIGHCIRTLKTDLELKLSGGANGLLSVLLNDINISLPENVYVMMRKKLLMPSVDGNVLNVVENNDGSGGGKYVIEYNAPLAAMDNEAKKELGKNYVDSETKDEINRNIADTGESNSESISSLLISKNDVFQESPDFPGYIRVLVISMEDIRVKLGIDRKELMKQLLLQDKAVNNEKMSAIDNVYDLTNITFLKDINEPGAYKINWIRPKNSFMYVDIRKLNILGSPSRITHYSKATLKPLKEQMRALALDGRERSDSDGKIRRSSMKIGRRKSSRRRSSETTEKEDANTRWYKNLIQKIRQYMLSPDLEVNINTKLEFGSSGNVAVGDPSGDVHAVLLPTNGKITMSLAIEEFAEDIGLKEKKEF